MRKFKLNCSLCGEIYDSEEAFPAHQVCPRCLTPGAEPAKVPKKAIDPDRRKKDRKKKKQARKNKRKNRKK